MRELTTVANKNNQITEMLNGEIVIQDDGGDDVCRFSTKNDFFSFMELVGMFVDKLEEKQSVSSIGRCDD